MNTESERLKVSFDFDSTLSEEKMQRLAKRFMMQGADVYVTTTRITNLRGVKFNHTDLFRVTDALGIDKVKVRFTEGQLKFGYLEDFDLHFDDDEVEVKEINRYHRTCLGVLFKVHNIKKRL